MVEASGLKLRGRGRVRQGVCPFHEETEASFTVYADTQRFYCFGCGPGGDVLDFIQRSDGVDLPEAIRRLQACPMPGHGGVGDVAELATRPNGRSTFLSLLRERPHPAR